MIPAIFKFSFFYIRAAVSACFYARLSCLHCQTFAAYLMFISHKLNDDDDDDDDDDDHEADHATCDKCNKEPHLRSACGQH